MDWHAEGSGIAMNVLMALKEYAKAVVSRQLLVVSEGLYRFLPFREWRKVSVTREEISSIQYWRPTAGDRQLL
jgi:hypothetical protein